MKTKRRIKMIIAVFALVAMCISGTALANPAFHSGLCDNTGQTFYDLSGTEFSGSSCQICTKDLAGVDWKIRANWVDDISTTYGIAFKPVYSYMEGKRIWLNRTSSSYRYNDCQNMSTGNTYEYVLYARSDDSLAVDEYQQVSGEWNAN